MPDEQGYLLDKTIRYDVVSRETLYRGDDDSPYLSVTYAHAVSGFRIPALPVVREVGLSPEAQLAQVLHRFVVFLRAVHNPDRRAAVGLYVVAHPERSTLGAEVGIYLLCRAAGSYSDAVEVTEIAQQVNQLFPNEGLFNYDNPVPLNVEALRQATFQDVPDAELQVVELRKFEDCLKDPNSPTSRFLDGAQGVDYIPHSFWTDAHQDPWLTLIETLAGVEQQATISLVLEPTLPLEEEALVTLAEQYRTIVDEGSRRLELRAQAAALDGGKIQDRSFVKTMALVDAYRAQGLNDYLVGRARRGAQIYQQLLTWKDQLFTMRVAIAARGPVPETLIRAVSAALVSPGGSREAELGWMRPAVVRPANDESRVLARQNLRWLGNADWGTAESHPKLRRLRYLVTAQEAAGLFHLPIMPQAGQTTALSTADVPFVIPPEVVSTNRFKEGEPLLRFGYLYQRGQCLDREPQRIEFQLRRSDLEKPSLLVGAPGSGKTNMAFYLLIQWWKEHGAPFLVLDPSTGHEYRYLLSEDSLQGHLLVYTLGDDEWQPFRFNPFAIPPGKTVRDHITRLLGCFKAAYEMWDPLPAIYDAALYRLYDREAGPPYLADFAQAIVEELEENVLPDYGKGTEAGGILTGASKIRVNGILRSMGHVLNVRQDDPRFFQELLRRPAVIELGALGDPSNIALAMAFLVTQLAGHIEHAYVSGARDKVPHLLLIEEAHRLLSETGAAASPNQGNVRGKSAEEMNSLLAEVRKFRQGIMVLDQRPSSLVGGVLDNAQVNILCRLSDRVGFEHLSNMLNLGPAQQRYARTRLRPGETLMLDTQSGQPVLVRPSNEVDRLQKAFQAQERAQPGHTRDQSRRNVQEAGLVPHPAAERPLGHPAPEGAPAVWRDLDPASLRAIGQLVQERDWRGVDQQLRAWLRSNLSQLKPGLLQQALVLLGYSPAEWTEIVAAYERDMSGGAS